MFTKSLFAVSGALLTAVAAVPMAEPHHRHHPQLKRDYVWVTETEEVIQTVPVTKTVWVEPGETIPTAYSSSSDDVKPAAYTPTSSTTAYAAPVYSSPAESSPQSTYVAPSSTSVAPVPTSTYVAPPVYSVPSTSVYVAPTLTSVYVASTPTSTYIAPTTSAAAATTSAASGSSDSGTASNGVTGIAAAGKTYTGDVTYYAVGMGSCGFTSSENEAVVAVSHEIMSVYNGVNPNKNPLCGTYLTINGKDGNKYKAKIVDTCPGCAMGSLDLPEALFNTVTSNGDGRVSGMEWCFD